jgi:hypothetical protein
MILQVEREELEVLSENLNPTRDDIAQAVAARFRALVPTLPKRRNAWQGEDERIGIFMAVAVALAGWKRFQTRR